MLTHFRSTIYSFRRKDLTQFIRSMLRWSTLSSISLRTRATFSTTTSIRIMSATAPRSLLSSSTTMATSRQRPSRRRLRWSECQKCALLASSAAGRTIPTSTSCMLFLLIRCLKTRAQSNSSPRCKCQRATSRYTIPRQLSTSLLKSPSTFSNLWSRLTCSRPSRPRPTGAKWTTAQSSHGIHRMTWMRRPRWPLQLMCSLRSKMTNTRKRSEVCNYRRLKNKCASKSSRVALRFLPRRTRSLPGATSTSTVSTRRRPSLKSPRISSQLRQISKKRM